MPTARSRSMDEFIRASREIYAEAIAASINRPNPFLNLIPANMGSLYYPPVILGVEHGVTFDNGSYKWRKATSQYSPIAIDIKDSFKKQIEFDEEWI